MNKKMLLVIFIILMYGCVEEIPEIPKNPASNGIENLTYEKKQLLSERFGSDLDKVMEEAELVFEGVVLKKRVDWKSDTHESKLIYTYITFQITEVIKGAEKLEDPESFELQVIGGTIGNLTLRVSHTPDFEIGDRSILFLRRYNEGIWGFYSTHTGDIGLVNIESSDQRNYKQLDK